MARGASIAARGSSSGLGCIRMNGSSALRSLENDFMVVNLVLSRNKPTAGR